MPPTLSASLIRLTFAILFAVSLLPIPAATAAGFLEDLKAQNKQHLAKPPSLPKENQPFTFEREYEDKLKKKEWTFDKGPLKIHITLKTGGPPDGTLYLNPVLTLYVDGKKVITSEGSESFPDNPVFLVQVAEMDPTNRYEEIIFSTFTGGAHCCSDTRILTSSKIGYAWREIEAGAFDGEPLGVRDLDGDGRYELVLPDNAFFYSFGCYACSYAPLHILRLQEGKLVNVSALPAFRKYHVKEIVGMVDSMDEDRDRNGFLAGYVAQKSLIGEGKEAWELAQKHFDRNSDWELDSCSVKRDEKGECPGGKNYKPTFPKALEKFLAERGYKIDK